MPVPRKYVDQLQRTCKRYGVSVLQGWRLDLLVNQNNCFQLGKGGYGTAHMLKVGKNEWVIKSVVPNDQTVDSLTHEIMTMATLQGQPGVQWLLFVCPESLAIITEYAGKTLENHLINNSYSVSQLMSVMQKVTKTLDFLHTQARVHLDIKADNICVQTNKDGDLKVTLIDYGLSRPMGSTMDFPKDTRSFNIAPEVIEGRPVDATADAYSMAKLMKYVGLTKRDSGLRDETRSWINQTLNKDPLARGSLHDLVSLLTL